MKNLYLIDNDENFIRILEKKLLIALEGYVTIYTITEEEYLYQYFNEYRKLGVLIIDEKLYNDVLSKQGREYTIVLTHDKSKERLKNSNYEKLIYLYKYQSLKELYLKIYSYIKEGIGSKNQLERETELISIYSPIGGAGRTTLALGFCEELGKNNKKVLYLNWESIQSYGEKLKITKYLEHGSIDLIKRREKEIVRKAIGQEKQFDYLLPFKHSILLDELEEEDFWFLLECCKIELNYDYILLDLPTNFNLMTSKIFALSNLVLVILKQDKNAVDKMNCFLNNADCSDSNKFKFICNQYEKNEKDYFTYLRNFKESISSIGMIGWDEQLAVSSNKDIFVNSDIKREIRRFL